MSKKSDEKNLLNDQQERFCQEYIVDLNITEAAKRAGYKENSAHAQGSRLFKNVKIQTRIKELMKDRGERTKVSADEVITRIDSMANFDPALAFDDKGHLKTIHDIPLEVRKCIKSIKIFEEFDGVGRDREKIGETVEVTWIDRLKANELLGKHHKLFTNNINLKGNLTLAEIVAGEESEEE